MFYLITKKCNQCGKRKIIYDFYRKTGKLDSFWNECKKCTNKQHRKYRKENAQRLRLFDRKRSKLPYRIKQLKEYHKTEEYKESHKKADLKWRINNLEKHKRSNKKAYLKWIKNNPEKIKAKQAVYNALRSKKLFKEPCKECGNMKDIQGHHEDYSKPLEVTWLCIVCHVKIHILKREGETKNG